MSLETTGSKSESLRLVRRLPLCGVDSMVNYVLLVAALTFVWVLYAGVRVGPWVAKRWKTWGEIAALLVFIAIELGLLITFLKPT